MFHKKQSSLDPRKEVTGKYLRSADKLVQLKRYTEALREIENAYTMDPQNIYIRSYLERVRSMITKEEENELKAFGGQVHQDSDHRMQTISQLFASAEEFIQEKKYQQALNMVGKVYRIDPKNYYANAFSDRKEILMQEEAARKTVKKPVPPPPRAPERSIPPAANQPLSISADAPYPASVSAPPRPMINQPPPEEKGRLTLYRELLKECWADGLITPEESVMLHRARSQYSISFDTHCRIEVEIKIDAYVDALRMSWIKGGVIDNEQEVLEIMRKKFGITKEEQTAAETKFSTLRQLELPKALILIVDNDYHNSIYLARTLFNHGYDVKIERQPVDALRFLVTQTPDLILSEAVFPQLNTDGFEFFHRTRLDERWSQIPFLMMTKTDDAHVMRAGLRMGIDHFIPKPVHIGSMIAMIEGKLKSGFQMTAQK